MRAIALVLLSANLAAAAVGNFAGLKGPRSPYKCGVLVEKRVLRAALTGVPYAYVPASCANVNFALDAHVPLTTRRGIDGIEVWLDGFRLVSELRVTGMPAPLSPDAMRRLCDDRDFRSRFARTRPGCIHVLARFKVKLSLAD